MTLTLGEESDAQMALRLWGKDAQMIVCIEELAELAQSLAKEMRASRRSDPVLHARDIASIAEELADVEIITNQIRCIFDAETRTFHDHVQAQKGVKLTRLRRRIDAAFHLQLADREGSQRTETGGADMSHHPRCPFCGSTKTRNECDEIGDDYVHQDYSCECGRSFTRVYEYTESWDEDGDRIAEEDA